MPGEIAPALRLLQAVCYPGHGVLLFREHVRLSSGDGAIVAALSVVAWEEPGEPAFTVMLDETLVACVRRMGEHTLAVAMPREIDTASVHRKLLLAIALYARDIARAGSPSGNGSSGAPAELSIARMRARSS